MSFAIAVHESFGGHGFFTFWLEFIDGDEVAILTFDHEWGSNAINDGGVADDGGSINKVCF